MSPSPPDPDVESFIEKWEAAQASERSNAQSFVTELTVLVGASPPEASTGDVRLDAYVFERSVRFHDGPNESVGVADLYKRGSVVLETKQGKTSAVASGHDSRTPSTT